MTSPDPDRQCSRCGALCSPALPGTLCPVCTGSLLFADPAEPVPEFDPAAAAGGRLTDYELGGEIGRGGMGVIFKARQISLNRPVAIKFILSGPLASGYERLRFLAEAEAAAALDHPGIVAIHEAGEADGQLFFAMQLIEGESLSARMRRLPDGLPPRDAVRLVLEVARAVQHAHERGFLHRDLKPGNILLDAAGAPHVTDFGLARRLDDSTRAGLTLTGTAVGTPSYMAPELTHSLRPPTTAVDVYSLGAILYELLSGHPPFAAGSLPELFVAIREREPASLRGGRQAVDRDLDISCRKCLEKEPARRYASMLALAQDLERWQAGEPIAARAAGRARAAPALVPPPSGTGCDQCSRSLLFLAGLGGVLWQWRRAAAALERSAESLREANINEARALRATRAPGQRLRSLAALTKAAARRPSPDLRNEAIAALALPDLGDAVPLPPLPEGIVDLTTDPDMTTLAYYDDTAVFLRRLREAQPVSGVRADAIHAGTDPGNWRVRDLRVSPGADRLFFRYGKMQGDRTRFGALCDPAGGSRVFGTDRIAYGAAFTADGKRLVLHRDGQLEVRDAAGGALLAAAACPLIPEVITLSPDQSKMVIGAGHDAETWTLTPLARERKLPRLPDTLWRIQWHPRMDELYFGCYGNEALVVRPGSDSVSVLSAHDREGVVVYPHPSGSFVATTAWDGIIRFCHPALREPLLRTGGMRPVAFSADGRQLLVRTGTNLSLREVTPPDVWTCLPLEAGPGPTEIRWLEFSPDGKFLALFSSGSLRVWNPEASRVSQPLTLEDGIFGRFNREGRLIVCDRAAGIFYADISAAADGTPALRRGESLPVPEPRPHLFALSPDHQRLFLKSERLSVWEVSSGRELFAPKPGPLGGGLPAWSADGRWLATGYWNNQMSGGSDVMVYSASDGSLVKKLPSGNCGVYFTPDGSGLLVSATHECVLYETGSWKELHRWPRDASGMDFGGAGVAPAAGFMALPATESILRLASLSTGEELARLTGPDPGTLSMGRLAMSSDGHWLATATTRSVHLWNLKLLRRHLAAAGLDWPDQPVRPGL